MRLAVLFLCACSSYVPQEMPIDLSGDASLQPTADLASPSDLAAADLPSPFDFTNPADLALPPQDSAIACGSSGLPCCPSYACSAGAACMRSNEDASERCVPDGACGGYNAPPCIYTGASWCRRDPYVTGGAWLHNNPCGSF